MNTPKPAARAHTRLKMLLVHTLCALMLLGLAPVIMWYAALKFPGDFLPGGAAATGMGAASSAIGLLFMIWALRELVVKGQGGAAAWGRLELTPKTRHLVTSGPYAVCRNPMHLGLTLYYLGVACALNSLACLLFPIMTLGAAYLIAVTVDEPRLRRDFGDAYSTWAAEVPRFWPRRPG